jgi:predicted dehydrogenase
MSAPVLLIGLGAIGMEYDYATRAEGPVLTHARAFDRHPDFSLAAAVDPDEDKRHRFTERYGRPAYARVREALVQHEASVAVIATPTPLHAEALRDVVEHAWLRAILCEKPLAATVAEARQMMELCDANSVELVVNFMRRADPGVLEVSRRLASHRIATPVKGVAWYSKGFLHNGSHLVNLLEHWLGAIHGATIVHEGRAYGDDDAEPDVRIEFARGAVVLLSAHEEHYSHFSVELVAPNGLLRYDHGGEVITWQRTEAHAAYSGYTTLSATPEHIASDMSRAQWHVADELAKLLRGDPFRLCTAAEAMRTLESMHRIMKQR